VQVLETQIIIKHTLLSYSTVSNCNKFKQGI